MVLVNYCSADPKLELASVFLLRSPSAADGREELASDDAHWSM